LALVAGLLLCTLWAGSAKAAEPPATGSITIVEETVLQAPQPFNFSSCLVGSGCGAFTLDSHWSATLPAQVSGADLPVGTYTITQAAVENWSLKSLRCTTGETVDLASRRVTITLTAGENVTCTFRNDTSRIHVLLAVTPRAPEDFTFTGCQVGFGCSQFTLDDDVEGDITYYPGTSGVVQPGTFTITQNTLPAGWVTPDLSCSAPATRDTANRRITITMQPLDAVTCVFSNGPGSA
jgi:hypothetical protein